jgi:hypothetical protein
MANPVKRHCVFIIEKGLAGWFMRTSHRPPVNVVLLLRTGMLCMRITLNG